MWAREAISANTERRCRKSIVRHNQPLKVLLTSELLTTKLSCGQAGKRVGRQLQRLVRRESHFGVVP